MGSGSVLEGVGHGASSGSHAQLKGVSKLVCDWCGVPFREGESVVEATKLIEATAMGAVSRQYLRARVNVHNTCGANYSELTPIHNPADG